MLSVAFAYFIHWAGLGLHWAFLIVFGAYLLIAGLLVFVGVRKVKQVRGPEKAISQGKEIPRALKGQGYRGSARHSRRSTPARSWPRRSPRSGRPGRR